MKYARIDVKCNDRLIKEVEMALPLYDKEIYIRDFFLELKNSARQKLSGIKGINNDCIVSVHFCMYCPHSVYKEAKRIAAAIPSGASDLYMLMEHISMMDEADFLT